MEIKIKLPERKDNLYSSIEKRLERLEALIRSNPDKLVKKIERVEDKIPRSLESRISKLETGIRDLPRIPSNLMSRISDLKSSINKKNPMEVSLIERLTKLVEVMKNKPTERIVERVVQKTKTQPIIVRPVVKGLDRLEDAIRKSTASRYLPSPS